MAGQRRRYSAEFKLEAVRMVVDQGHPVKPETVTIPNNSA